VKKENIRNSNLLVKRLARNAKRLFRALAKAGKRSCVQRRDASVAIQWEKRNPTAEPSKAGRTWAHGDLAGAGRAGRRGRVALG
jgi:hypothetical protein